MSFNTDFHHHTGTRFQHVDECVCVSVWFRETGSFVLDAERRKRSTMISCDVSANEPLFRMLMGRRAPNENEDTNQ